MKNGEQQILYLIELYERIIDIDIKLKKVIADNDGKYYTCLKKKIESMAPPKTYFFVTYRKGTLKIEFYEGRTLNIINGCGKDIFTSNKRINATAINAIVDDNIYLFKQRIKNLRELMSKMDGMLIKGDDPNNICVKIEKMR